MLGAIIGDLAGSIYEFAQVKNHKSIDMKKVIEDDAFFSDDSILTVAIADAILSGCNYEEKIREYVQKFSDYKPTENKYFKTIFSVNFSKWACGDREGNSSGNGAMMRISAVGNYFKTEEEVIENARLATIPSHNSTSAIECATKIALVIFFARQGMTKDKILERLNIKLKKPKIDFFNYLCEDTIDVCLYSAFMANNFEEAIKIALSFGGDTDTNACIVGSIAENLYGISDELKTKALSKLPKEFIDIIQRFYSKI